MIDAGTISASLLLDTAPFAAGIDSAMLSLALLGSSGGEQETKIGRLGDALAAVGSRIYTEFETPFIRAATEIPTFCTSVADSVANAAMLLSESAATAKENILSPVRETVSEGSGIMRDFGQGLINGLSQKQSSIFAKARYIANTVAATMKSALGIASPSRVMRQVGRFTGEGLVLGLQDMKGEVENASKGLAEGAVTAVTYERAVQTEPESPTAVENGTAAVQGGRTAVQDTLSRKLDMLIDLLSCGRQTIEIDRRTFGTLVREYA